MKTHVIQLEPHDDVISIRDKMSWAKTGRILLVFPTRVRSRFLTLDLRLLQREGQRLSSPHEQPSRGRPLLRDVLPPFDGVFPAGAGLSQLRKLRRRGWDIRLIIHERYERKLKLANALDFDDLLLNWLLLLRRHEEVGPKIGHELRGAAARARSSSASSSSPMRRPPTASPRSGRRSRPCRSARICGWKPAPPTTTVNHSGKPRP